ncbi:Gp49 family protein [Acinetobacter pragensis]|uniref:Gp49 family protein n=1 Tax=Acinetobacter pragensis TaxID=1806892 RepID=UPI0033418EF2
MKFSFNTTPKMIPTAVAVLGSLLALGAYKVGAAPSGAALPVFVGVCAFAVLLFSSTQINLAFQVPGQPALPEPRERTHRQELELAMAHGMGALVANPSYAGKRVGENIREALDAMLVQSAPASLAELRWGMNAYPGRADQHKCLVHSVAACPCHKASDNLMRSAGYEGEQAPASGGPRVTLADIEAEIVGEHYFTAAQGAGHPEALNPRDFGDVPEGLALLTICVLRLSNGTKLVGINYGAIDPDQHDADLGRKEARADAVEKIWELLGFRLRDKLAAGA